MAKGSIQQGDILFINIYKSKLRKPKCIKQILTELKEEIDCNTLIIGNFNNLLLTIARSSWQSINIKNIRFKLYIIPDWLHRHLQNMSSKSSRVHILKLT